MIVIRERQYWVLAVHNYNSGRINERIEKKKKKKACRVQKLTSGKCTLSNNNCLKLNGNTGSIKRLSMHATKNGMKRIKIIILLHFPQQNQHFQNVQS